MSLFSARKGAAAEKQELPFYRTTCIVFLVRKGTTTVIAQLHELQSKPEAELL